MTAIRTLRDKIGGILSLRRKISKNGRYHYHMLQIGKIFHLRGLPAQKQSRSLLYDFVADFCTLNILHRAALQYSPLHHLAKHRVTSEY